MTDAKPLLIYILNGPNLNLLGEREPEIYGRETLADIEAAAARHLANRTIAGRPADVIFRQSNHEGALVDWVQEANREGAGLIVNAAAYTHTSIALHDALSAAAIPKIELHLSNIHAREPFRRHSYVALASDGVICGFGAAGYALALDAMAGLIEKRLKQ